MVIPSQSIPVGLSEFHIPADLWRDATEQNHMVATDLSNLTGYLEMNSSAYRGESLSAF